MLHGKGEEVEVGEMLGGWELWECAGACEGEAIWPELVTGIIAPSNQVSAHFFGGANATLSKRSGKDAQDPILGQGAGGPTIWSEILKKARGCIVVNVVLIQQGNEDVDVEKRGH